MDEEPMDLQSESHKRSLASFFSHKRLLILATLVSTVVLGSGLLWLGPRVRPAFDFLLENLPLTLPVLTVILSVATRPHELRTLPGLLNTANYFALGLVTFAIWAYVAAQGASQYILVGKETVLNKDYALLLLLGAFTWAGFSAVVTALAENSKDRQQRTWQYVQSGIVAVSFVLLISPFFLFEEKEEVEARTGVSFDEVDFTVSIAFQDPALDQHLGRSTDPLKQCQVYRSVSARGRDEAVRIALEQFAESEKSHQFASPSRRANGDEPRSVQILDSWIVAEPEERGIAATRP